MRRDHRFSVLASAVALAAVLTANLPALVKGPDFTRKEDVVYGRKYGTALTMDVFTPKENANGAAVVWVISGGWFSAHEAINPASRSCSSGDTRSLPWSTAASRGTRFPRSSPT